MRHLFAVHRKLVIQVGVLALGGQQLAVVASFDNLAGFEAEDVHPGPIAIARPFLSRMQDHASTRTTQLYDRRRDEVSLDEVERIVI